MHPGHGFPYESAAMMRRAEVAANYRVVHQVVLYRVAHQVESYILLTSMAVAPS